MSLHETAVNAEQALEQLATGLAQAGVDDATVKAVGQMASITRKIVKQLGKGQESTGDKEPPAPPAEPQPETMDGAINSLTPSGQGA